MISWKGGLVCLAVLVGAAWIVTHPAKELPSVKISTLVWRETREFSGIYEVSFIVRNQASSARIIRLSLDVGVLEYLASDQGGVPVLSPILSKELRVPLEAGEQKHLTETVALGFRRPAQGDVRIEVRSLP